MIFELDVSKRRFFEQICLQLNEIAEKPEHEQNRDLIADFIEGVMLVEIKSLGQKDETFIDQIELPNDVLLGPLMEIKKKMDEAWRDFSLKEVLRSPAAPPPNEPSLPTSGTPIETSTPTPLPQGGNPFDTIAKKTGQAPNSPAGGAPRIGNGHSKAKKRDLTSTEKDSLRAEFIACNGQIEDDACVSMKTRCVGADASIFQVTGFVSYLHRRVAGGEIRLRDIPAYETFIRQHRVLWSTYDSPKYRAMRAAIPLPQTPAVATAGTIINATNPTFTNFPVRQRGAS